MGHANRPGQHDALGLDAQPRRICLSASRRSDSKSNTDCIANSYSYANANTHRYANPYCYCCGNTYSYANTYTYANTWSPEPSKRSHRIGAFKDSSQSTLDR